MDSEKASFVCLIMMQSTEETLVNIWWFCVGWIFLFVEEYLSFKDITAKVYSKI